ncbi:MAG: alpha/beta hydrolase [Christensenellaceae bacterium]|jgi:acetyl esterase/lipase|nr:alpha/beta hydrolase [Christensenellaceae bacterium]
MKVSHYIPKILCSLSEVTITNLLNTFGNAKNIKATKKIHYSDDKNVFINVYEPIDRGNEKLPIFLYVHGGGWVSGGPRYRRALAKSIAAKGYIVVSVFYGLAPKYKFDSSIKNLYTALEFFLQNADKYGADIDSIYAGGDSAGAHLACALGVISSNDQYRSMIADLPSIATTIKFKGLLLICGIYNMDTAEKSGFSGISSFICFETGLSSEERKATQNATRFSPIEYITKTFPKTFVITAQNDKLQSEGFDLAKKLHSQQSKYRLYHGTGFSAMHAFPVAQFLQQTKRVIKYAFDWLP